MSQGFLAVLNASVMASTEKKKFHFPRCNITLASFDAISKRHAHSRSIL